MKLKYYKLLLMIFCVFLCFSCAQKEIKPIEQQIKEKEIAKEEYKNYKNNERKDVTKEDILNDYKKTEISKTLSDEINSYYINSAYKDTKKINKEIKKRERIMDKNPAFSDDLKIDFNTDKNLGFILSNILREHNLVLKLDNGVDLNYPLSLQFEGTLYDLIDTILSPLAYTFDFYKPNIVYVKAFVTRVYKLRFLNMEHEYTLDFTSSSAGGSDLSNTGGSTNNSGQNFALKVTSKTEDMWTNIEEDLRAIMSPDGKVKSNKNSGTISITDRVNFFDTIDTYVESLNDIYSKQVFLDVTVIEVALNKSHQHGVDWGFIKNPLWDKWAIGSFSNLSPFSKLTSATPGMSNFTDTGLPIFTLNNSEGFTEFLIGALNDYGNTEVKAHPKQLVLNKQAAVIPIGQIITYISNMTVDTNEGDWGGGNNEYSTETSTIMDGVTLQFLPDIDDNDKISMNVGVLLNKLISMEKVPLGGEGGYVQLPTVNNRADMTTVRMHSGDSMVIGGLIMDETNKSERGLPILMKIPYLGNLFKYESKTSKKTELIIILKARVLHI